MAASDSAGKGSRVPRFTSRLEDFAGFMTHPFDPVRIAAQAEFAVSSVSKAIEFRHQLGELMVLHIRNG